MALPTNWQNNIGMQVDADFLNSLGTEVNAAKGAIPQRGHYANLPTPGNEGRLYVCDDTGLILRDNGTSWDRIWGGDLNAFTPPPSTSLTTTALGTATLTADKDSRLLVIPGVAGNNIRAEYAALPSRPFTATGYFEVGAAPTSSQLFAILMYNSSSGQFVGFGKAPAGNFVQSFASATAAPAAYGTAVANIAGTYWGAHWYRLVDDGTAQSFQTSINGVDWDVLATAPSSGFAPTHIGWGGANPTAGTTLRLRNRSFKVTTP